ncbi:hypothetical protein [Methanobrevibacter sp.]|uniref:DNA replication complex subunit Gins51 n=1 Tax=Methanobrevibacter sp. TaxID=66852 RepID=UPI00388DE6E5
MQGDFFQVLRRVQKEERNKSSLARVENDFYKQLRDYIRNLERSVASDPFGNEQLLLNNAQRIATEICELRESKITKAANNNIYRSFLLFKKDNPQFDLLDTTPLNLTDEEETLYFALMDALKSHRYRISLDEYAEEGSLDGTSLEDEGEEYDKDFDEDGETSFVEDSYESAQDIESESSVDDDLEDEISDALGESDEVLNRLNQIKNAKVVTDEKYENIDKQVVNQKYPDQAAAVDAQEESVQDSVEETQVSVEEVPLDPEDVYVEDDSQFEVQVDTEGPKEEVQSTESSKPKGITSDNINDIFKNPDSQFVDLDKLEPNYDDDYYNAIAAGSDYAQPSEDDFNLIFAKPKKPKAEEVPEESKADEKEPEIKEENLFEPKSAQSELGFSSGLDVKQTRDMPAKGFDKPVEKEDAPKKPVDKTRGGVFARDEIENATVVISENLGEMVGIDGKIYGPFLENDVVILPNITAQILIENNKASLVKH